MSGCSAAAISCAVAARLLVGAEVAAASDVEPSASCFASGGLKKTGNGDPPVGVPLISTVSYAAPHRERQPVSLGGLESFVNFDSDPASMQYEAGTPGDSTEYSVHTGHGKFRTHACSQLELCNRHAPALHVHTS